MSATKATEVVLGGRPRTLRFTNRALVAIEDRTGLGLVELGARVSAGSLKATAALVWAGLLHEEPKLTLEDAIDLLDLPRLEEIGAAAAAALEAATVGPDAQKEDAAPGNPPATD